MAPPKFQLCTTSTLHVDSTLGMSAIHASSESEPPPVKKLKQTINYNYMYHLQYNYALINTIIILAPVTLHLIAGPASQ